MATFCISEKRTSATNQTIRLIEARDGHLEENDIEEYGIEEISTTLEIMLEEDRWDQGLIDDTQASLDNFRLREAQAAENAKRPYKAA